MAENLVFGFYDGKITPYYSSVTIVIQISSPNLVSIRLLSDSRQTLDGLLMDSWQTPDGLLTDSWQTPDRFLTDSQQTHIKPKNRLRNLESCPNQLSNFGELSKSALQFTIRLLTDSWLTPNFRQTHYTQQQTLRKAPGWGHFGIFLGFSDFSKGSPLWNKEDKSCLRETKGTRY